MTTKQRAARLSWFPWVPGWLVVAIILAIVFGAALGTVIPMMSGGKTATTETPVAPAVGVEGNTTGSTGSIVGEQAAPPVQTNSTTIERPAPPVQAPIDLTFRGRTAPSTSFPLSDEKYIELGKQALLRPETRTTVFTALGNPVSIDLTPVEVKEWVQYLHVYYRVTAQAPERSADTPPFLDVMIDPWGGIYSVSFTGR